MHNNIRVPPDEVSSALVCVLPIEPEGAKVGTALARLASLRLGRRVTIHQVQRSIRNLRALGYPVVSQSNDPPGYRMATTAAALRACITEHRQRAVETLRTVELLERARLEMAHDNRKLF